MIKFFYGDNLAAGRQAWREALKNARQAGGAYYPIEPDNFNLERLEELIAGQDIFGQRMVAALDEVAGDAAAGEFLAKRAEEMVASPSVFIWYEAAPPSALVRAVTRAGAEVKSFVKKEKEQKSWFDASSLAGRDRRRLWLAYQRALHQGLAPEQVFWPLVWQTKKLLLGRRPANFPPGELEQVSSALVRVWHDSRRLPGRDFALGLERLILTL